MRETQARSLKKTFRLLRLVTAATVCTGAAHAQELLVHLPLDGTVQNAGSGGTAEVVGPAPATVQGQLGGAMKFDGNTVIAVPVDLSSALYPQLTITAWVKADASAPNTNHTVVSSGSQGTTPALRLAKRRNGVKGVMRGARGALLAGDFAPTEEWVFIAGTVDVPAQTLRLLQDASTYQRDGIRTHNLYSASSHVNPNNPEAESQAWVFVGARTFETSLMPTVGIAIDDVRVYGGKLDDDQLAAIRDADGTAGGGDMVAGTQAEEAAGPAEGSSDGMTLEQYNEQLAARNAEQLEGLDDESQTDALSRDRSAPDDGTTLDDINQELAARNSEQTGNIDYESPADAVSGDRSAPADGKTVDELNEDLAEQNAELGGNVDYESPTDTLARDGNSDSSSTAREDDSEGGDGNADTSTGWHFSATETHLTTVSGRSGDIVKQDDSFDRGTPREEYTKFYGDEARHLLILSSVDDIPCSVVLNAGHEGYLLGDGIALFECAGTVNDGIFSNKRIRVEVPGSMTAVQVCTNRRNGRVKGFEIRGHAIESDGTWGAYAQDTETLPNCSEWATMVVCRSQHVATGMIAHFDNRRGTSSSNALVGLQLICRKVVKGGG